ncbi:MAG: CPBP family glutamic-type intramembrane protease [Planctomycetota bacterium]|jgi:hypothetical protein
MSQLPPRRYSLLVYLEESARPLVSLFFILPILLTYEIGWRIINAGKEIPIVNGADAILKKAFQSCGFYGSALSAVMVILTLILLHLHRRHPWRFHPVTLAIMAGECLLVAMPVFLLEEALKWVMPMAAGIGQWKEYLHQGIYSLGAGVYEEYLFRLLLLGLLFAIAHNLQKKRQTLQWIGIFLSAILFSAFHYIGEYGEEWRLFTFAFRSIVGIYFAWIYTARGFGVVVGCHAVYNLMVIGLRFYHSS